MTPKKGPVRVEVTAEDIRRGERCEGCLCPVALAIRRALGEGIFVQVADLRVAIGDGIVHLPAKVGRWIYRYDKTGRGEPFSFDLK